LGILEELKQDIISSKYFLDVAKAKSLTFSRGRFYK
jgi:hypothetical protein